MTTFHHYNTRLRNNSKRQLAEYSIQEKIGEGAFSKVYKAFHIPTGQHRALKKVNLEDLDDQYQDLCYNEVKLLQKVNCQNVLQCFTAFTEASTLYVILEYVNGVDMEQRIMGCRDKGACFSERTIWYFFHQICNGIKALHAKRILHRDIKPANIFTTFRCVVKIGDLGLSRMFSQQTLEVKTRVGSEYYMAPERNSTGKYHFKSDIWSLGCLLYEMATFRNPFNGEVTNAYALHKKIATGDTLPFPMAHYSSQLHHFVNCCLATSPNDRPTAEECHEASRQMYQFFEFKLKEYNNSRAL